MVYLMTMSVSLATYRRIIG